MLFVLSWELDWMYYVQVILFSWFMEETVVDLFQIRKLDSYYQDSIQNLSAEERVREWASEWVRENRSSDLSYVVYEIFHTWDYPLCFIYDIFIHEFSDSPCFYIHHSAIHLNSTFQPSLLCVQVALLSLSPSKTCSL